MKQSSLFQNGVQKDPLAARLCPASLQDYVGQKHLLGKGKILYNLIEKNMVSSMTFWGPPGVGKATLARIIARQTQAHFIDFSAITSGVREIKAIMEETEDVHLYGRKTIVFADEVHRFSRAQQDTFLPYVEKGNIILIGAATEDPLFEVNAALLPRCKVFVLKALEVSDLVELLKHALQDERGFGLQHVLITEGQLHMSAVFANGDTRTTLNTLKMVVLNGESSETGIVIIKEVLGQCTFQKSLLYDRQGEEHCNLISALHKSMCNSDMDTAIYQLARMLEAGEDPLYVARRLVCFASEDIGMADNRALETCVAIYQACRFLGMPECNVYLTHAVTYLSPSPKFNVLCMAYGAAKRDAVHMLSEPVPLQIRNAPTSLMEDLHYGEGYQYAHDTQGKLTNMGCMPESLGGREYYHPAIQGSEARVSKRLQDIREWKRKYQNK